MKKVEVVKEVKQTISDKEIKEKLVFKPEDLHGKLLKISVTREQNIVIMYGVEENNKTKYMLGSWVRSEL